MKKILFGIALLFYCVLLACCAKHSPSNDLQIAESVMNEYPDSALRILRAIPTPEKLEGKERADYCLLLTQAMDKNDEKLESDSLINIAIEYYKSYDDNLKKTLSYIHKARHLYEIEKYKDAALFYKKAEEIGITLNDNNILGMIYNHLAHINQKQRLEDAILYFREGLKCEKLTGNIDRQISNIHGIAIYFAYHDQPDSAEYYFNKSLDLVSKSDAIAPVLHNIGAFYHDNGNYDKAFSYLQEAIKLEDKEEEKFYSYAILADIYLNRGEPQIANEYLSKSLKTTDIGLKTYIYELLYTTALKKEEYSNFSEYIEGYVTNLHAIYKNEEKEGVMRIQKQYDNESLLRKNLEAEINITRLIAAICLLSIFIIILILLYRYNRKIQNEKTRKLISIKEVELQDYKSRLTEIEQCLAFEGINSDLLTERAKLLHAIENQEKDIKEYKKTVKQQIHEDGKIELYQSVLRGAKLYSKILNKQGKTISLTSADFIDIIRFYYCEHKNIMDFLMIDKFHLSAMETVICILFHSGLTHQEVADCLGNTSDTLAKSKMRIKKNKFNLNDNRRLEEILLSI